MLVDCDQVRDEIRMTIAAYQTLYESSIAFGQKLVEVLATRVEPATAR